MSSVLMPVADAYYNSVSLLVFTGQVGTKDMNFEKKLRQTGFQETDTVNIFKSVTKKLYFLDLEEDISKDVYSPFVLTREGRPRPVVVGLPMDIQRNEIKHEDI